ncbi:hypothetical protein [Candidatus Manganitrophus noduliformans]|uniref:1,4-alpha-glucan branching enzyme n=1 Tax=Candidatus Manganitrophus noduliformans TaxID=2606439 RepID=A0A7X6ICU9_9BACT|nr:hypothetical protein [Candidatus Manganitrophus noduliformans]NKE72910.1 hypothetical protein [Candidatus Manganitrophus noduliformans]
MAEKAEAKVTTDPETIRRWAEARGGKPAVVKGTDILRINFPGGAEAELEDISWPEFFQKLEEKGLAFLYQEKKADGEPSTFNKLVSRETVKDQLKGKKAA